MAKLPRRLLRTFFEKGDKPTESQFAALIDSMLHTTEDADKLGLRNHDPERSYLAGDAVLYDNILYQALVNTSGPFNRPNWKKISAPAELVTEVSWIELSQMVAAGALIKGTRFLITDFTSGSIIVKGGKEGGVTYIHPVDPMIVIALSSSTISHIAFCPSYPQDVIHYNFEENRITYRKDTNRNLSAHYDWRHWKFTRYESSAYKGDFIHTSRPMSEPRYLQGVVTETSPGTNQIVINGDAVIVAQDGTATFMDPATRGRTMNVVITGYSFSRYYNEQGVLVETTYLSYDNAAYPALTAGLEMVLVIDIRSRDFYTFGNTLTKTTGETEVWQMIPAPDGNAGADCINIEIGPVSNYWWRQYANGHIFDSYCYNIKIGHESVNITFFQNVWDVELGPEIYGGLVMGNNARIFANGGCSLYIGQNTASINVLSAGQLWEFIEIGELGGETTYKVSVGDNCYNITLLNCSKSGTRLLPGIPSGTVSKIYSDGTFAHEQNTDTTLALGTADAVTAAEIRTFLDAATGHILYVDAVTGNDSTGKRNSPSRPFRSITGALSSQQFTDGDTVIVLPGEYTDKNIGDSVSLDGKTIRLFCYPGANITADGDIFSDTYLTSGKLEVSGYGNFSSTSWVVNYPQRNASVKFKANTVHGAIGGFAGNRDGVFYVDIIRATGGCCIYFEGDNATAYYKAESAETVQGIMLMDLAGPNTKVYAEIRNLVIPSTVDSNQYCSAINVNTGTVEFRGNISFNIPTPEGIAPQGALWTVGGNIVMHGNLAVNVTESFSIHCWNTPGSITFHGNITGGQAINRGGRVIVNGEIITNENRASVFHSSGITRVSGWVVNQNIGTSAHGAYVEGSGLFLDKARIIGGSSGRALVSGASSPDVRVIDTVLSTSIGGTVNLLVSTPVISTDLVY